MPEAIDGEIVDVEHRALAIREEAAAPLGLFNTDDPSAVVTKAVAVADALMAVVKQKGWAKKIGGTGKDYLEIAAWQTIGAMLGVSAVCEWSRPIDGGWEARVNVVNSRGLVIASAESQCTRDERNWKSRDDFALRSMSQTRASGKALRMALGFIASIAGFSDTPAEEMPDYAPPQHAHGARSASDPPQVANRAPTQAQATRAPATETPPADAGSLFDGDPPAEPEPDDQAEKRAVFARLKEHDADTRLNANDRMRLYMTAAGVANRSNLKSLDAAKRVLAAYENALKDLNEADAALEAVMQAEIPI